MPKPRISLNSLPLLSASSRISAVATLKQSKRPYPRCLTVLNWFGQFRAISTRLTLSSKISLRQFLMKSAQESEATSSYNSYSSSPQVSRSTQSSKESLSLKNGTINSLRQRWTLSRRSLSDVGTSTELRKFSQSPNTWRLSLITSTLLVLFSKNSLPFSVTTSRLLLDHLTPSTRSLSVLRIKSANLRHSAMTCLTQSISLNGRLHSRLSSSKLMLLKLTRHHWSTTLSRPSWTHPKVPLNFSVNSKMLRHAKRLRRNFLESTNKCLRSICSSSKEWRSFTRTTSTTHQSLKTCHLSQVVSLGPVQLSHVSKHQSISSRREPRSLPNTLKVSVQLRTTSVLLKTLLRSTNLKYLMTGSKKTQAMQSTCWKSQS